MSAGILKLNGIDVDALEMSVIAAGDIWSPPEVARQYSRVPGRLGAIPRSLPEGREKRIPVTFHLRAASPALRTERRETLRRLLRGVLRVEWDDTPGRHMWALIDREQQTGILDSMQYVVGHLRIETELIIPAAVAWDTQPQVIALEADEPTAVPVGTAVSTPLFLLPGAWTTATITVDGLDPLELAGTVASDEVVEVYTDTGAIVLHDTGTNVRSPALGDLYSDGRLPVLDPWEVSGDTMTVTSTVAATMIYQRAWE